MTETERVTEYGVELPIGIIQWGIAFKHPTGTEAERALLSIVLRRTAQETGWPEDVFLAGYKWRTRTIIYNDDSYAIDDEMVAPLPQTEE